MFLLNYKILPAGFINKSVQTHEYSSKVTQSGDSGKSQLKILL